jgi:DNA topoisomerase-1
MPTIEDDNCCAPAPLVAEQAGLRYVHDDEPGLRRRRVGRGFSYRYPDGSTLTDPAERQRIAALAIPPAWTDVWICPRPDGHIQATGRDARGRKQYRYHPRWREVRDADKFDRLLDFGEHLGDLRARLDEDLRLTGLPRERILALVVRLLDDTLIRVGNPEYAADNDTYGLTTLRRRHVEATDRRVTFEFVGKSGVDHEVTVTDRRLAPLIRRCSELGGHELFTYLDDTGQPARVTSTDVNEYVRTLVGRGDTSAKDFRTWGGTVIATETLAGAGPAGSEREAEAVILRAVDAAAETLRNTRTVARQCYIHPAVPEAYRDGALFEHWRHARTGTRYRRAERATLAILRAHTGPGRVVEHGGGGG